MMQQRTRDDPALADERSSPKQDRAHRTRDAILQAAAELIGRRGYEAATLTEIAQLAGKSIGSLYRYFPDKHALGLALAVRFGEEIGRFWEAELASCEGASAEALVTCIIDIMMRFQQEQPAYLELVANLSDYRHEEKDRLRLRAAVIKAVASAMPPSRVERAPAVAEVLIQSVKSLGNLMARGVATDEHVAEHRHMLDCYLASVFSGSVLGIDSRPAVK